MNRRWGKYLLATSIAGAMVALMLWGNGFGSAEETAQKLKLLADAFTLPGVLLPMLSALIWAESRGFFHGIGYAGRVSVRMIFPFLQLEDEKYYDYKRRKAKRAFHGYSFLFYVGAVFFAVALGFTAAFCAL